MVNNPVTSKKNYKYFYCTLLVTWLLFKTVIINTKIYTFAITHKKDKLLLR